MTELAAAGIADQQDPSEPLLLGGRQWTIDAADLLAEPDPGPTPWLVENLIVEQALIAAVGRWKTTKSYALLDVCVSVATGRPAFGALAIPKAGPVVFVNEESGRAALWRRLDALCRGRAIDREELRGRLHLAANERVKLDDPDWHDRLLSFGDRIRPRLFVFDPLARMKAPERKENEQGDMAVLVEFIRRLRDETGAAVAFVHHTGHQGAQMRGSSDLESIWETRLTWKRDGQSSTVDLESEHREAEAAPTLRYRISWDAVTRTMRFAADAERATTLSERILARLDHDGPGTAETIAKDIGVRLSYVTRTLAELENAGKTHVGPSGRTDKLGRPIRDKCWKLRTQAVSWPIPLPGMTQEEPPDEHRGSVAHPLSIERGGTEQPPDEPPGSAVVDELSSVSANPARAREELNG